MTGVGKRFSTAGQVHEAVRDVDLEVAPGEFVSLLGPSGCGKSTLLNIAAGYEEPTSGTVTVRGKSIRGPGTDRVMVFQEFALFPWRTVRANVEFGLEMVGMPKAQRQETAGRYLEMVGLTASERKYPIELSGGMKQRTAIARALAIEPEILLLDEPFGALDAQTRDLLQEELLRIWMATQKTIMFVTHSIEESIYLSDRIVVMTAGPGGHIKKIIDLSQWERPRDRSSPEFSGLSKDIRDLLRPELEHVVEEERES
ncbi:MAG: ATP-binding cassette domain-containing protein [Nitriliruptorales bacterium]|nr:ATP-binding cassette domain-containing protein [Nitriliruptorales bacterium]